MHADADKDAVPRVVALRSLLPPPSARVQNLAGASVDLVDELLQTEEPDVVVLGWLRHFGCTLCMRQAAEWNRVLRPRLARGACRSPPAKVLVALVGSGTVEQANAFAEETGFDKGMLYTDPQLLTYTALGFARGVQSVLNRTS
jgi:AhpC/TSA antioxidant enzyme